MTCVFCRKPFSVFPYRINLARYCSQECYGNSKRGTKGYWLGKKRPLKTKLKIKLAKLKNPTRYWLGKHHSTETKDKISTSKLKSSRNRGKGHFNWKDGKSFEPYGMEFNNKLKEEVRKRDNFRCQECFRHQDELYTKSGIKYRLQVHHIDYNKKNSSENNLISLCNSCHVQTNFGREDWTRYYKEKNLNI